MTTATRSAAPPFDAAGIVFEAWIMADGQEYRWRSRCGDFEAGREIDALAEAEIARRQALRPDAKIPTHEARYWLAADGRREPRTWPTLLQAMHEAVRLTMSQRRVA